MFWFMTKIKAGHENGEGSEGAFEFYHGLWNLEQGRKIYE